MDLKDKPTLIALGAITGVAVTSAYFLTQIKALKVDIEEMRTIIKKLASLSDEREASTRKQIRNVTNTVQQLMVSHVHDVEDFKPNINDKGPGYVRRTKRKNHHRDVPKNDEDDDIDAIIAAMR
jgi:hypothetical protein